MIAFSSCHMGLVKTKIPFSLEYNLYSSWSISTLQMLQTNLYFLKNGKISNVKKKEM